MPLDDEPTQEAQHGIIDSRNIVFLESIAMVENMEMIQASDPQTAAEFKKFLDESMVFIMEGFTADTPDEHQMTVIAMPMEAVLFIIASVIRKGQEENGTGTEGLTLPPNFLN
jgi:hypothetical protein